MLNLLLSAAIVFGNDGAVESLKTEEGRELIREKVPFVSVDMPDGREIGAVSCRAEGDRLVFGFPDGLGECVLRKTSLDGDVGWTFKVESLTVKDAYRLYYARVKPVCTKYFGLDSGILSDDESGVMVRAYELKGADRRAELTRLIYTLQERDPTRERGLQAATTAKYGLTGYSAGLIATSKAKLRDAWKTMTIASGAPYSVYGGPWAQDHETERGSYLFATWMDMSSLDDWLLLCEKAAIGVLHFHAWWDIWGLYDISTNCFPRGLADMKKAADRMRAIGVKPGMHTMSGSLQFGGPDLTPVCSDDVLARRVYTLARDFKDGDDVLYVNEPIACDQDKVLTGDSNGNLLKLGGELVEYADFVRERPYRFTGVKRGYMKTTVKKGGYAAGTEVVYPSHRFTAFFPRPDTRLADTVADRIAKVYNACGVREIFFDGSEGPREHYTVDALVAKIFSKLNQDKNRGIWCGMSHSRAYFNWMISHKGAWDYPTRGPKQFCDCHVRCYREQSWESNLIGMDLGWWLPWAGDATSRGFYEDEFEYAPAKAAQIGAVMSFHGFWKTSDHRLDFRNENWMTIAGWWGRAQSEKLFKPGLCEKMSPLGDEWRLRQGEDGVWRVAPLFVSKHLVSNNEFSKWNVDMDEERESEVRVEALYSTASGSQRLLDDSNLDKLVTEANKGVSISVAKGSRGGLVLRAKNTSAKANESWCCVKKLIGEPYLEVKRGCSLWVKGDGSGATLNVQFGRTAHRFEGAYAEQYVKLDFNGWRKVDFLMRESDADQADGFEWPYWDKFASHSPAKLFRSLPTGKTVGSIAYYLNGIRPETITEVEVSALDGVDEKKIALEKSALVVGDCAAELPFALASGEYAELKGGTWTRYAPNGEPLKRVKTGDRFILRKGANAIAFHGYAGVDDPRAEVTFLAPGKWEEALVKNPSFEAEMLEKYAPADGFDGKIAVRVSGGVDRYDLRIDGPIKNPAFSVLGKAFSFPVELGPDDRIVIKDGKWRAERVIAGANDGERRTKSSERRLISEGSLAEPLPALPAGETAVFAFSSSDPDSAQAHISIVKRY